MYILKNKLKVGMDRVPEIGFLDTRNHRKIGFKQRGLEKEISFLILQVQNPARSLLDSTIKSVFWTKVTEGPKN